MKAPAGHKYVIILTLPSGAKFACAGHEGKFALVPIGDGTKEVRVSKVLAFDDSKDAAQWMKKLMAQMEPAQREGFMKMRPDLGMLAVSIDKQNLHVEHLLGCSIWALASATHIPLWRHNV